MSLRQKARRIGANTAKRAEIVRLLTERVVVRHPSRVVVTYAFAPRVPSSIAL